MKKPSVFRISVLFALLVLSIALFSAPSARAEGPVKLGDERVHRAYLFAEPDGSYMLSAVFTRREAARMMEALLEPVPAEGEGFKDLDETDAALPGAMLMRACGMLEDGAFRPDDALTKAELFRWLSLCFPPAESAEDGPQDDPGLRLAVEKGWFDPETEKPADKLTRMELLLLMNRVLGRETALADIPGEVCDSLMDYQEQPVLLAALAEAGVTHSCASLRPEQWEEFTILRRLAEGPHNVGSALYWADADGRFVVDRVENGLLFDETGRYTSGDPELDALVREVLDEVVTEKMTQYQKLRAVYNYTLYELRYGGAPVYEKGTYDWWQEAARNMLSTTVGNCYSFAAAFCALSRPLGYDTKVTSGSSFQRGIHGWAYIMFDGEEHIFDPQSEKNYHLGVMFDLPPAKWAWIEYDPVYSGDEAP